MTEMLVLWLGEKVGSAVAVAGFYRAELRAIAAGRFVRDVGLTAAEIRMLVRHGLLKLEYGRAPKGKRHSKYKITELGVVLLNEAAV